jgi:hypothetical protein
MTNPCRLGLGEASTLAACCEVETAISACFLRTYLLWRARSCPWSSSGFLQFETRGPGVGAAYYPTSGTAIEFQFVSLFVTVSFLKVRARARARAQGLEHRLLANE